MYIPASDLLCTSLKKLLANLTIHFSRISPCGRSWYCLPRESCEILYIPVLKCEIQVDPSPQAEMYSDCVSLYITLFCLLPYFWHRVHCLKGMNDYGKLMPFRYFLTRITSFMLIPFIFLFYSCKECKWSLRSYRLSQFTTYLGKLERQK